MATSNSLPACVLNVSLTSVSSASACEVSSETSTPIGVGTAAAADPAGSRLVTTPVHNPTASSPARNLKRVLIAIPHDPDIPDGPRPPSIGHPTATRRPLSTIAQAPCPVNPAPQPNPALNGSTEGVNGLIELQRRIARGFRNRD